MPTRNAAAIVGAAVPLPQNARASGRHLRAHDFPLTDRELHQHAEMIDKVIRAGRKLQLLRDRAQALERALGRFKARREAKRA